MDSIIFKGLSILFHPNFLPPNVLKMKVFQQINESANIYVNTEKSGKDFGYSETLYSIWFFGFKNINFIYLTNLAIL